MGKHNIEKKPFHYRLLYWYTHTLHNLFYREFYTINRPEKKSEKPSIITPNHQNALMDALAVLFAKDEPMVFLARSDIFKQKPVAAILYFLKILPVYRIRDGFDSLKNNQETFDHTVRLLSAKRGLVILPEGSHYGAKHLRQLKKGFARIAFMTEINSNEKVDLQIVPTAIDYTAYNTFFSRLTVVFGEPFPIKPYMEEYKTKPNVAINNITKKLSEELKKHIIHIESEQNYEECLLTSAVYAEQKHTGATAKAQEKRFETQRSVTQKLNEIETTQPETFADITTPARKLLNKAHHIPAEILAKKPTINAFAGFLLSSLLIPFALPGTLLFGLFWYWPVWFVNQKIKDVQFRTSVRFVLYIVQFILLFTGLLIYLLFAFPIAEAFIFLIAIIISGVLSIKIWRLWYWFTLKTKWFLLKNKNAEIEKARQDIIEQINRIMPD